MYVIAVYDVNVARVNKVKSYLRQYLFWVQNSVFEGELSESEYLKITKDLKNIINEDEDSIIIYKVGFEDLIEKEIYGIEKSSINNIL